MAVLRLQNINVNIKLENGYDMDGNTLTVAISLDNISKDNFDPDKALAIVGALEPCLSKAVEGIDVVQTLSLWFQ